MKERIMKERITYRLSELLMDLAKEKATEGGKYEISEMVYNSQKETLLIERHRVEGMGRPDYASKVVKTDAGIPFDDLLKENMKDAAFREKYYKECWELEVKNRIFNENKEKLPNIKLKFSLDMTNEKMKNFILDNLKVEVK